jgi:hypothetical protein
MAPDYPKLANYSQWYNLLAFGPPPRHMVQAFGLLISLAYGLIVVYRGVRRRVSSSFAASCGFMVVNILGLNLGMVLCVPMDQNRFRYRTDALSVACLALMAMAVYRAGRRLWMTHNLALAHGFQRAVVPTDATSGAPIGMPGSLARHTELLVTGVGSKDAIVPLTETSFADRPQGDCLRHLDEVRSWLEANGQAMSQGRAWNSIEAGGGPFTAHDQSVFVLVSDPPAPHGVPMGDLALGHHCTVIFLGRGLDATPPSGNAFTIVLRTNLADTQTYVFKVARKSP